MPHALAGERFYAPGENEGEAAARLERIRAARGLKER
jgi:hypothetical protein